MNLGFMTEQDQIGCQHPVINTFAIFSCDNTSPALVGNAIGVRPARIEQLMLSSRRKLA